MGNLKKIFAMTLVMVMMVSVFAMPTSAKVFDDVEALNNPELSTAIDLLSEMGIAKGYLDGNFGVNDPVTRQQFALFTARIHSAAPEYFVPSTSEKDIPPFSDVTDNTYFTAINYCYENYIINGTVEPTSHTQKSKMLVLTLCRQCESDFRSGGSLLVKIGWQEVKEDCDFCKSHKGLNFAIFDMKNI